MKIIKEYVLEQKNLIKKTVEKYHINKKLVIIQSVSDGATNAYVKGKCKDCDEVGIAHEVIRLDESAQDIEYLVNLIKELNIDETVGGIIVQLPLFDGWDVERVQNAIDPRL
ncbi:MAG: tetrahydrofolate dehydrogenase/cyclohydrolase catalytic domain-containing protein, partial [Candidatus Onthovivens sp.]|nr:tetrahydrofolate dehydrogenase/cyclohydrolase catalytic domain-containing protein [Candidatus Onthovivens sp.]